MAGFQCGGVGLTEPTGGPATVVVSPNARVRAGLGALATLADAITFAGPTSVAGVWIVPAARVTLGGVPAITAASAGLAISPPVPPALAHRADDDDDPRSAGGRVVSDGGRFLAASFPLAVDAAAGRIARVAEWDAYVAQLVRQVLLTSPGERVNRPDFGAGLRRLVFAPNSPATASLVQTTVFQALDRWLGALIRVDEVTAAAEAERLLVTVTYTVLARQERRILDVEVVP